MSDHTVIPQSFDGHNIQNLTYRSFLPEAGFDPPDARPIENDTDFWLPSLVGNQMTPRVFTLRINILDTVDYYARRDELMAWFDPQRRAGALTGYLVALWPQEPVRRRILCQVTRCETVWNRVTVTLRAVELYWETADQINDTWTITATGQTRTITNRGNARTQPVLRCTVTAGPANSYLFRRPVVVTNQLTQKLVKYPVEVTGGGWNTAALVARTDKATLVDDGDGITAADTTITVDATTLFYASGLIYFSDYDEQVYYAAKTATQFTGCIRGVNGTTAHTHANNVGVFQSEMAADGGDVRVELDDVEIPRWFGGAYAATAGMNTSATKIWVNIPELPARPTDRNGGDLMINGLNLATGAAASANSSKAGRLPGRLIDGIAGTVGWSSFPGAGPFYPTFDLLSLKVIDRVRLRLPDTDTRPEDFLIQTSTDNITYADTVTVTGNAVSGAWLTYDFNELTARYVRVSVSAIVGEITKSGVELNEVEIYHARSRLQLKYGNPLAGQQSVSDDTKPLLSLATSTNSSWIWTLFGDLNNPQRTAAWGRRNYAGLRQTRPYSISGGALTDTWPNAVMGVATAVAGVTALYADAWQFSHPAGITAVNWIGYTRQNPSYRELRLIGIDALGHAILEDTVTTNSQAAASPGTAFNKNKTLSATAVTVIVQHYPLAATTSPNYAEVTDLTATLSLPPVVSFQAALSSQQVDVTIENTTLGHAVTLRGLVALDQQLDLDFGAFSVAEVATGLSRVGMLSWDAVRQFWMELGPGANVLEITGDDLAGMTIVTMYREKWL